MSVLSRLGFSRGKLYAVTAALTLLAIFGIFSDNKIAMISWILAEILTLALWRYGTRATPDADADDDDSWPDDVG